MSEKLRVEASIETRNNAEKSIAVLLVVWLSATGFSFLYMPGYAYLFLAMLLFTGTLWVAFTPPRQPLSRKARWGFYLIRLRVVLSCAAVILLIADTQWPVRLTAALSQPAFDALANRVERGEKLQLPCRAGLFVISRAEMSSLDSSGMLPKAPVLYLWGARNDEGFIRAPYSDGCYGVSCVVRRSANWLQVTWD